MSTRIEGIVDKVSDAEHFSTVEWVLGKGPITNFVQSTVDSKIKANLEFQGKAGLPAKVVRKSRGYCCEWCNSLIGEYEYPDVPPDVYRRHDNCNCIVTYYPGDGRARNVHTKAWYREDPKVLERRKLYTGVEKKSANKSATFNALSNEILKSTTATVMEIRGVKYNPPIKHTKAMGTKEIIESVGALDTTAGSCTSVAYAYLGNRAGYSVKDFRGGKSNNILSTPTSIDELARLPGVVSYEEYSISEIAATNRVLEKVKPGKEYILSTGKHTAIVRKVDNGKYEYLELQTEADNGFEELTNDILLERFFCKKSYQVNGIKYQLKSLLIDAESLYTKDEFIQLLGYINR